MAKVNKHEPCIFCGTLPCSCLGIGVKPKRLAAPKRQPTKSVTPAPPVESVDPWAEVAIPEAQTHFKVSAKVERDLTYEAALQVLLPILAPSERLRVEAELRRELPQEVDRRKAEWKAKHGT